jgi:hypothetical protein
VSEDDPDLWGVRPPPPGWHEKDRGRRSKSETALKVLAGVAVFVVLGTVAAALLFVWAMSSYGSNK